MQKKKIYFIIIMLIIGIHTNVFAFDLLANVSTQKLEQKQVQISLQVSDLEENTDGINAISGKIVYDSNVFEKVSLTGVNNWTSVYNDEKGNENEGKFILITTSGNVTQDTEVANIELILKPDISNIKTQIKIEGIQTSYHSEKITSEDKYINLEIDNNEIKLIENKLDEGTTNEIKNYSKYILIAIIAIVIILILIVLIIKSKERKTNEK